MQKDARDHRWQIGSQILQLPARVGGKVDHADGALALHGSDVVVREDVHDVELAARGNG
jgi:hypothetical protein